MNVSELTGATLDYWVAKSDPRCEGLTWEWREDHWAGVCDAGVACFITGGNLRVIFKLRRDYGNGAEQYSPSTNWQHGGPIIEREFMELTNDRDWREDGSFGRVWQANDAGSGYWDGDTPLIAAMRAFVASKYGKTVPEAA
jgi:hypothetical protein